MYLIKLLKEKKFLFLIIVGFFLIQIFINAKRGLTATPFLHYGMYSGKASISDTLIAYKILLNDKELILKRNLPEINDQIFVPLKSFLAITNKENDLYHSHINKYLGILKLPYSSSNFTSSISESKFLKWYKERLERICDEKVYNFNILLTRNIFSDGKIRTIDSVNILSWN